MPAPRTNIPEFSVSELASSLKRTLEDNYGHVRVRGELGRVTVAASGHMYATLKDDGANIDAVCWKGTIARLGVRPAEGLEVVCTGRITTYQASSKYQIIIDTMELAGQGALLKMLDDRKQKLAAEGLFDQSRKRPIPFLPDVIGVITSPTGAVIRDILHRLADRFPRHVIVWPVPVQGVNAAEKVANAINGFQTIDRHGLPRPDLIIVARGGGSLEDLMPFNEEIVVRAAAASSIPLISAVGHETDTTLIDYAADLRAPTPTAAAEHAVPRRIDLLSHVLEDEQRLVNLMDRTLAEARARLEARAQALGDPHKVLELRAQRLDHTGDRLERIFRELITAKKTALITQGAKLRHPRERVEFFRQRLSHAAGNMNGVYKQYLSAKNARLANVGSPRSPQPRIGEYFDRVEQADVDLYNSTFVFAQYWQGILGHYDKMLEAYSFKNVLRRGYAVVRTEEGALISDPVQARPGQMLEILFGNNKLLDVIASSTRIKK